jgi:diguanylate cyclase (GGDEF)-like protein
VSPDLEIRYISPGIEPLVGRTPQTCVGQHISDVLGADVGEDIIRAYDTLALSDYVSCEWHLMNHVGEERSAYARLTRRQDGSLVLNLRDVTEQRALEARLEHRANIDALTGLPNRAALTELLRGAPRLEDITVLFIDLDGFKEVNDSLGHDRGDGVLQAVAVRIASSLPADITVGRLGGDEFLAIMRQTTETRATRVATRIISAIEALGATETRFPLSASIGIACGTAEDTPEDLLHRADQAMYRAKAHGPGRSEIAAYAASETA